jgi:hypothetical protein
MNNDYAEHLFEIEKELSTNSYYFGLLLPELKMRNNEALFALQNGDTASASSHLNVLNHELIWKDTKFELNSTPIASRSFAIDTYTANIHDEVKVKLDSLVKVYRSQYNGFNKLKDRGFERLIAKFGNSNNLLDFKQTYYNKTLANWVLAKNEIQQIAFDGEKYIQKKHPIYKEPNHPFGRAQFYAPYKWFAGLKVATPLFNMLVVWLMTISLFFTLYFRVLRRTIAYFERFKLRRLYRRLQKMST